MIRNRFIPFFFIFLLPANVKAQEKLRLKDAIAIALEKNYDVQLSKVNKSIADGNNEAGNAGMLPAVVVEGGYSRTDLNLSQTLADGRVIERDAATSENISGAARLTWTLFDGMRMFAAKSRLEANEEMFSFRLKAEIENKLSKNVSNRVKNSMIHIRNMPKTLETSRKYSNFIENQSKISEENQEFV